MNTRKNALLLFSKVPKAGQVKTRLTPIKDGIFDPQVAATLYHCMLFDVVEICMDACTDLERANLEQRALEGTCDEQPIQEIYDIFISSPGKSQEAEMRELFANSGTWPRHIIFINDNGASFDEHYNDAFKQVLDRGYDTILSLGCDMPALRRSIIIEGFERLHDICDHNFLGEHPSTNAQDHNGEHPSTSAQSYNGEHPSGSEADQPKGGIVLAPDQEMGVSLVGWTAETKFDHTGIYYNKDGLTVLPAYIQKAMRLGLPVLYLPDVPDVDTMADLNHNVTLVQALEYCAKFQKDVTPPYRTAQALREIGYDDIRVAPNDLRDDRSSIDI